MHYEKTQGAAQYTMTPCIFPYSALVDSFNSSDLGGKGTKVYAKLHTESRYCSFLSVSCRYMGFLSKEPTCVLHQRPSSSSAQPL